MARLRKHCIRLGIWDEERHAAMDKELAEMVRDAAREAEKNGILGHGLHHPMESLFEDVFEEMPWHLKEQQQQMLEIGRASCRERVCQYVWISVGAVAFKKKEHKQQ